jgi:hypothetical protein
MQVAEYVGADTVGTSCTLSGRTALGPNVPRVIDRRGGFLREGAGGRGGRTNKVLYTERYRGVAFLV